MSRRLERFPCERECERGGGKSMTVPGQAITVQELYQRYGGEVPMGMSVRQRLIEDQDSFDDPDYEKIAQLDPVEQHILRQEVSDVAASLQSELDQQDAALKKEEALKAKVEAKVKDDAEERPKDVPKSSENA